MESRLRRLKEATREQGFRVSETADGVLVFQKDGNTHSCRVPERAIQLMDLLRELKRMGFTSPF